MTEVRVVYVTAPRGEASDLARQLVERRLCACVNIIEQVRSVYRWDGKVHDDPESLLIIKTTQPELTNLQEAVASLHSYDVPEFIALPVTDGSPAYLSWVAGQVGPEGQA